MTVKAILTVSADCAGTRADPRALLPVVGRPLVGHQVDRVAAAGISRIYILVPEEQPRLRELADKWRGEGLDIRIMRDVAEIAAEAGATDRLLLIGDSVLASAPLVARFAAAHTLRVGLLLDEVESAAFERVDINHRWAGLANIGIAELRAVAALPSEWSGDSALMRQAMQHGAGTELIRPGEVRALGLALPVDPAGAEQLSARLLAQQDGLEGDPVERLAFRPLSNMVVPILARSARPEAGWIAGPALAALALLFAGFGLAGGAGIAALAALLAGQVERRLSPFQRVGPFRRFADRLRMGLLIPVLPLLAFVRPGETAAGGLLLSLLLLGLIVTVEAGARRRGRPAWMPGGASAILLVTLAALGGHFAAGLWSAAFLLTGASLAEILLGPPVPETSA